MIYLTPPQASALRAIEQGHISVNQIADHTGETKTQVFNHIRALDRSNAIRKHNGTGPGHRFEYASRNLPYFEGESISQDQASIIESIELGHITNTEIGEYLAMKRSSVKHHLKMLVGRGILEAHPKGKVQEGNTYSYTGAAYWVNENVSRVKAKRETHDYRACDLFCFGLPT